MKSRREGQTLRDRVAEWQELVEQCGRKPTRKRVHALRVITLRIQAEAEHALTELPHASHEAQAVLRFGKRASRLRQALGSVREHDVWMTKLSGLRGSFDDAPAYVPRTARNTLHQVERIEERLARKRRSAAKRLIAHIEKRHEVLLSVADDMANVVGESAHETDGSEAPALVEQFVAISAEFPEFNEDNLHDFRKRIKNVRYLADLHSDDARCVRIASQLKRVQDAIGEWHDWQILAQTAKSSKHARTADAGELLQTVAAEAFERALAACDAVTAQIGRLDPLQEHAAASGPKKPVSSDAGGSASGRMLA